MAHAARGCADRRGIAQVAQHKLTSAATPARFSRWPEDRLSSTRTRAVRTTVRGADETGPRHQTLVAAHHAHPPPSELANCGRARAKWSEGVAVVAVGGLLVTNPHAQADAQAARAVNDKVGVPSTCEASRSMRVDADHRCQNTTKSPAMVLANRACSGNHLSGGLPASCACVVKVRMLLSRCHTRRRSPTRTTTPAGFPL